MKQVMSDLQAYQKIPPLLPALRQLQKEALPFHLRHRASLRVLLLRAFRLEGLNVVEFANRLTDAHIRRTDAEQDREIAEY